MSILDSLVSKAGNIDLNALAEKVGMNPDELRNGGEAMLARLATGQHDAESASVEASAETGIDPSKLQALLPALSGALAGGEGEGDGMLSGLMGKLGGLGGMLDRDGDGNPLNDIQGFAKGLFGKS